MKNRIYLDNAATTPLLPAVFQEMAPYFTECFGNPSGIYGTGREARRAVENARKRTAEALGALPQLKNCEAHSTVILPAVDDNTFRRLGVNLTCDPSYQSHKLYHK